MTTPDLLTVLKEGAERTPSVMEGLRQRLDADPYVRGCARRVPHRGDTRHNADTAASAAPAAKRMLRQAEAVQAALVLPTWFTEITARGVKKAERVLVTT